ncbi:MAG: glycosyltransferase family 2 protein [archaeon]
MQKKNSFGLIVPTLNEEKNIEIVLKKIPKKLLDEILVIDGHSNDKTLAVAKKMGFNCILQDGSGLGDAYRSGARKLKTDYMIILDADGSHKPEDIKKLIEKALEGFDLVVASRLRGHVKSADMTFFRLYANYAIAFAMRFLFRVPLTDPWMGFRIINRKKFLGLNTTSQGQEVDLEMSIKGARNGFKISEIDSFEPKRMHGKSKFNVFFEGMRAGVLFVREFIVPNESHKESSLIKFLYKMQKKFS